LGVLWLKVAGEEQRDNLSETYEVRREISDRRKKNAIAVGGKKITARRRCSRRSSPHFPEGVSFNWRQVCV